MGNKEVYYDISLSESLFSHKATLSELKESGITKALFSRLFFTKLGWRIGGWTGS